MASTTDDTNDQDNSGLPDRGYPLRPQRRTDDTDDQDTSTPDDTNDQDNSGLPDRGYPLRPQRRTDDTDDQDTSTPDDTDDQDYSHLFRNECLISDVDLHVGVAKSYSRVVVGDEDVSVTTRLLGANGSMNVVRGSRDRTAGSFEHRTDNEITMNVSNSVEENVEGPVHLTAGFAAEAMVGGPYVNTIAGVYMRLAGWTDFLVWGGWVEADAIRCELSLLMIRSHVAYVHAAGVRMTAAARLIDDFQTRSLNQGVVSISGATYMEAGDPAGGISNEA